MLGSSLLDGQPSTESYAFTIDIVPNPMPCLVLTCEPFVTLLICLFSYYNLFLKITLILLYHKIYRPLDLHLNSCLYLFQLYDNLFQISKLYSK